ncbi:DUF305 domain-containing protein [Streptomyces sp. NPDC007088]|uniref:DUF305 domain-containing protein n=1 Tax=Streptomyces sp. NPDC007088 TaxID=3364773 RepID=UPI0036A9173C
MFRHLSPAPARIVAHHRRAGGLLAAGALCLALALTGCDSGAEGADAKPDAAAGGPSVIAPGRPGEAARTLSPQAARKSEDDSPNSADFRYVTRMIEHHEQALTLTGLVPDRAGSGAVERLARRIAAAQGPETEAMKGWLANNGGKDKQRSGGHDHASMPGMATPEQLRTLRAARGAAFDKLFLKLMIAHHEGAVTMATEVLAQGNNLQVEEMADDVVSQQSSEIHRMRGLS